MEVKPGFQQTEVGVIPEEWDVDSLGCFWNVTDCKHVTAQFVNAGYPIASIMEVQSRFVDLAGAKQTTEQFYKLLIEGGRKPRTGDLILSRNATVGEVA
jgi:type I restriction enzyme S subunit